MFDLKINKLLPLILQNKEKIEIKVNGFSMEPTLHDGDLITINSFDDYFEGDILVFIYKHGDLLVHRLLKKEKGTYFCKGDNSFRLEDIKKEQIVGRVSLVNGLEIESWTPEKIELSYRVNREFRAWHYNIDETKKSEIYTKYKEVVFKDKIK